MKTKTLLTTLILGAICQFAPQTGRAQDVDSMAPVVVKTVPEAGTKDVAPGEMEIRVTFSKDMMDQSWSWCSAWNDSDPAGIGKPHYDATRRTCILKVKLEPNKTYGYWINSQNHHGFQDAQGHPAVPYLLVFQTKGN
jgi:RNA polymerase sigma-70 factor (ECF subfamily)